MPQSKPRSLRALALGAGFACLTVAAQAAGAPSATDVAKQSFDAFNKGDMAAIQAILAPEMSIVDEFAPHEWHGANAFQTWQSDFAAFGKSAGQTDQKLVWGGVIRSQVDGDSAYVVVRATYTYKQHGHRMSESGEDAFALHNGADGWKITGLAWAGSVPHAVTPKPNPAAAGATPAAGAAAAKAPTTPAK